MWFCNSCGKQTQALEKSHLLNRRGHRTGVLRMVCPPCHANYHSIRDDWVRWGRQGYEARKKRRYTPTTFRRKGFPDPTKLRRHS